MTGVAEVRACCTLSEVGKQVLSKLLYNSCGPLACANGGVYQPAWFWFLTLGAECLQLICNASCYVNHSAALYVLEGPHGVCQIDSTHA